MSSEHWQRVAEIFQQALDRAPEDREIFLEANCGGQDSVLRKAVGSLLEADGEGEAFLEEPLVPGLPQDGGSTALPLPNGGRIGSYRLLREIGHGGMSTVFLAVREDSFKRRVAIKLIRQGMESEDTLRRLRTERQILASLDHPFIARIFDGGATPEGLPYFVMEYVEGSPIEEYCDHHRLSVRARIVLFRKVLEAVHYAHQNLVVHRDLKPSNILVTRDRDPKLLDFGIAKLLNPELSSAECEPTVAGMRLMTPHYASPEQVRGGIITTGSDIYSLGALLFKLISGHLPYDLAGRSPGEVERLLTESEPRSPSDAISRGATGPADEEASPQDPTPERISWSRGTRPERLWRQLHGDLDQIVLKALRPDPERRYGSAAQFSEDLRRYLEGLPVSARRGNVSYRLTKLLRRNWASVAAAALFVGLVFAFAVAMALQSARIAVERDQAQRQHAEKNQVLALVEDIFRLADPSENGREDFTVMQALDHSSATIERRLQEQPAVEASLRTVIGTIYLHLHSLDEAEAHLRKGLEIRGELYGEDSLEFSETLSALGAVLRDKGEYAQAEALLVKAVAGARRRVGNDHPGLIGPLNHLVALFCHKGDHEAAEEPSREALTLARKHLISNQPGLAAAVNNRAVVLRRKGDLEAAERLYREGLEIQRILVGEEHPEVANILNNLAVILKTRGDYEEAARLHRQTLALRRKLYSDGHPTIAQSLVNLAAVLRQQGKYQQAEAAYGEAIALLRQSLGEAHPLTLRVVVSLALMQLENGQAQAAERSLRGSLESWRAKLGAGHELVAWAESVLGESLGTLQRYPEAEALLTRSLSRLEERFGDQHEKTRRALKALIAVYEAWGKPEKAAEYRGSSPQSEPPSGL